MGRILIVAALAMLATACTTVSSAAPGSTAATGDAWFAKRTMFLGMVVANDVVYCPKETPTQCKRAQFK